MEVVIATAEGSQKCSHPHFQGGGNVQLSGEQRAAQRAVRQGQPDSEIGRFQESARGVDLSVAARRRRRGPRRRRRCAGRCEGQSSRRRGAGRCGAERRVLGRARAGADGAGPHRREPMPASRCWRPFPMPNRGCAKPRSSNWAASRTRPGLPDRLADISRRDAAYRVRAAALNSYAQLKPNGGLALLQDAAKTDSPDDVIRRAALRAMGPLGDDKAVSALLDWSEEGKPIALRTAAIASLAQLDKKNQDIGKRLTALLDDQAFEIRSAAVSALGDRGRCLRHSRARSHAAPQRSSREFFKRHPARHRPLEARQYRKPIPRGLRRRPLRRQRRRCGCGAASWAASSRRLRK